MKVRDFSKGGSRQLRTHLGFAVIRGDEEQAVHRIPRFSKSEIEEAYYARIDPSRVLHFKGSGDPRRRALEPEDVDQMDSFACWCVAENRRQFVQATIAKATLPKGSATIIQSNPNVEAPVS